MKPKGRSLSQGHAVATTIPPQLARAVSEATHPVQSSFDGPALYQLEEYLTNPHEAQAVYYALLQRASAEPISLAVVLRSVNVLKGCLQRFEPSEEVLDAILEFCSLLGQSFAHAQPDLQKSVLYLETLALNILHAKHSAAGRTLHARGISEQEVLRERGSHSSLGNISDAKRSVSQPDSGLPTLPIPLPQDAGKEGWQPGLAEARRRSGALSSKASEVNRPEVHGLSHDLLSWRWAEPDVLMPGMNTPAPGDLRRYQVSAATQNSSVQPPSDQVQGILNAVDIVRQRQRDHSLGASHLGPEALRPKLRDNRPRLLFQHQPYSEQDKLDLSDSEISAVVEGVLDVADGAKIWTERFVLDFREASSRALGPVEQPSRLCSSILIKLLIDLWSSNQASMSFPLALMMLSGGLESSKASIRARAFDVIFNASIHAELLYPAETSTFDLEAQATEAMARKMGDPNMIAEIKDRAAETLGANGIGSESGEASVPVSISETNKQRFLQWLRLLLFQLMLHLKQEGERDEEVWLAALGAFLQLTVENGEPSIDAVENVPPCILSTLLNNCVQYHWSVLVHNQLVRIVTSALYLGNGIEGKIPLNMIKVEDFGGVNEVMAHFKQATSEEAARNLLAVILDHIVLAYIEARGSESREACLQDASLIGFALSQGNLVAFLQGGCLCAWPRFGSKFAKHLHNITLQPGNSEEEQKRLGDLIDAVFERVEEIACECAVATPPEEMLETVRDTIASAKSGKQDSDDRMSSHQTSAFLPPEWAKLAKLLSGKDDLNGQLASSWLLSLLVAVADKERVEGENEEASFKGRAKAAFPQLVCNTPSPKFPSGIDSPALAALLRNVLSQPESAERASSRLVVVVKRFLIYLQSTYGTDPVTPIGSQNLGKRPEAANEVLSDFFLDNENDAADTDGPTAHQAPATEGVTTSTANLILPVLSLVLEWLYEVAGDQGQHACLLAAELLVGCVTSSHDSDSCEAAASHSSRPHDWIEEQYNWTNSKGDGQNESRIAAQTQSKITAFLSCAVACPIDTLRKLSPVFLSRLYHHLGDGHLPAQPSPKGMQAALWARDVRAAVFLLLISRCSLDKLALQQAGGEGVFVDLLTDADPRVRFHAAVFLQQRLRTTRPEVYRRALTHIMQQALINEDDELLQSAHLQVHAMLEQKLIDFSV